MSTSPADKRATFRALHQEGCFILPNFWDVGSARLLAHLGFKALASTSAGVSWTLGKPDYGLSRDDVLSRLTAVCAATDLPVNADFESGFADDPEALAANVTLAIETGIAGLSIEDRHLADNGRLFDDATSAARIRAARMAIDQSGQDVLLVARTERLVLDHTATSQAIDSLIAMAEAGADCLYAPAVFGRENITAMVKALAPKPVNVLTVGPTFPGLSLKEMADIGVRRVSVGSALATIGWGPIEAAAEALLAGSLDLLAQSGPHNDLNKVFAG